MSDSNKPSLFEAVSGTISEMFSSRRAEDIDGIETVAKTISDLGYLVSLEAASDNLTQPERQLEVEKLEQDFAAPAFEAATTSPSPTEVAMPETDQLVPEVITDELQHMHRRQEEARQLAEKARQGGQA